MEFAIISESSADEAALHAFCEALLEQQIPRATLPVIVRRGWSALRQDLPVALRAVRFRTTADVVLVVADSDGTSLEANHPTNRLAQLQAMADENLGRPGPNQRRITAITGLAVPCIEAWWLAHSDHQISEVTWLRRHDGTRVPYDKPALKRRLYGTDRVGLPEQTRLMVDAARAAALHAEELGRRFPRGLMPFLTGLRGL
jgi:hypothetical protein